MTDLNVNKCLITGAAGFIGFSLSKRLLEEGIEVVGLDNLNDYYDVSLKESRLQLLSEYDLFTFVKADMADRESTAALFEEHGFDAVVNLAAQAGVRYSLENPHAYVDSNLTGFVNILEGCRHTKVKHLLYASSSSVYGANTNMPFSVHHNVDHPVSLYAATKKSNELLAHSYSHLFGLPCTGLRFFTVYGPWGRPDMAYHIFVKAILAGKPINVFNHGNMRRDFTYIDDIVESVFRILKRVPTANQDWSGKNTDPGTSYAPFKVYNIGNNSSVMLNDFISEVEESLGKTAKRNLLPMQKGDVAETYADVDDLINDICFKPSTSIKDGVRNFVNWYKAYYSS
ncbi:NAD-dependent epimerase [Desulfoluna spongiiphila]|uniref:UDP-glucuronate 4-epimerase n=1 Tax=Desulfoluna spongiiphila TaxID=419481 RepID=A0A1G5JFK4_9BACT|nr:NAD-dependent epimerase [Desulfoluna spongiiphila]SCY87163.1 UDP-glucuronate 4-epimerase [Desulfoluna spongiiphila]